MQLLVVPSWGDMEGIAHFWLRCIDSTQRVLPTREPLVSKFYIVIQSHIACMADLLVFSPSDMASSRVFIVIHIV